MWRILIVGATDHYVKVTLDPQLKYGLAGHPDWIHGHQKMLERSYLYVPRGAKGVHLMLAEFDVPRTRKVTLKAPDGAVLSELVAPGGAASVPLDFEPGLYDDKLLTLEVGPGDGDFMVNAKIRFGKDPEVTQRGERVVPAVFAADEATATALRGGAIYHDDRVFWQPYAVRMHDWLKTLPEDSFVIKNEAGEVALPTPAPLRAAPVKKGETPPKYLPSREGFLPLNGRHWKPPLSDVILYHYPAHKNQAAMNVAVRDLIYGLRSIGPNDHVAVATGGPYANMAYEFGAYAWHYWRPAWRLVHETNAPEELKQLVKDAMLVCGDRLSFCRAWERVNGNSYALVLSGLRYCYATTGDALQEQLFNVYWDRFTNGGWGDRVGVGPSGPIQEGFAYAYHYGSYIMETWPSVLADFHDERFQKVYDRIHTWWSYTCCDEQQPAGPWCARTHHYPQWFGEKEIEGPFAFKGLPGPDFTVAVNDYNEWFAARRPNYYALTYHGRLSPKWEANTHNGQAGYGGGMICQLSVPGRGPVIASTLNGSYGEGMHPSQWKNFHLHTVVGNGIDGEPIVSGDSEHFDAKLDGNVVTSSGDVRQTAVRVTRGYTFDADAVQCRVQLGETQFDGLLSLWVKNPRRGQVATAYEMIPFVPNQPRTPKTPKPLPTVVTLTGADGKDLGELTTEPQLAQRVTIDRGGFGVTVELNEPRRVHRGQNHAVLIELADKPTPASEVKLEYRLVPFNHPVADTTATTTTK